MLIGGGATGKDLEIDIIGHNLEETTRLANEIESKLELIPGAVDVAIDRSKERAELEIIPDREKIASVGLNTAMIANTIRQSIYGVVATKYREEGDQYDIFIRYKPAFRESIADVENIPVRTLTGQLVKVKDIATIKETLSPPEIRRKNQERVVTIGANISGRALGEVTADIQRQIAQMNIPPGIDIEYGGQVEQQSESFRWIRL